MGGGAQRQIDWRENKDFCQLLYRALSWVAPNNMVGNREDPRHPRPKDTNQYHYNPGANVSYVCIQTGIAYANPYGNRNNDPEWNSFISWYDKLPQKPPYMKMGMPSKMFHSTQEVQAYRLVGEILMSGDNTGRYWPESSWGANNAARYKSRCANIQAWLGWLIKYYPTALKDIVTTMQGQGSYNDFYTIVSKYATQVQVNFVQGLLPQRQNEGISASEIENANIFVRRFLTSYVFVNPRLQNNAWPVITEKQLKFLEDSLKMVNYAPNAMTVASMRLTRWFYESPVDAVKKIGDMISAIDKQLSGTQDQGTRQRLTQVRHQLMSLVFYYSASSDSKYALQGGWSNVDLCMTTYMNRMQNLFKEDNYRQLAEALRSGDPQLVADARRMLVFMSIFMEPRIGDIVCRGSQTALLKYFNPKAWEQVQKVMEEIRSLPAYQEILYVPKPTAYQQFAMGSFAYETIKFLFPTTTLVSEAGAGNTIWIVPASVLDSALDVIAVTKILQGAKLLRMGWAALREVGVKAATITLLREAPKFIITRGIAWALKYTLFSGVVYYGFNVLLGSDTIRILSDPGASKEAKDKAWKQFMQGWVEFELAQFKSLPSLAFLGLPTGISMRATFMQSKFLEAVTGFFGKEVGLKSSFAGAMQKIMLDLAEKLRGKESEGQIAAFLKASLTKLCRDYNVAYTEEGMGKLVTSILEAGRLGEKAFQALKSHVLPNRLIQMYWKQVLICSGAAGIGTYLFHEHERQRRFVVKTPKGLANNVRGQMSSIREMIETLREHGMLTDKEYTRVMKRYGEMELKVKKYEGKELSEEDVAYLNDIFARFDGRRDNTGVHGFIPELADEMSGKGNEFKAYFLDTLHQLYLARNSGKIDKVTFDKMFKEWVFLVDKSQEYGRMEASSTPVNEQENENYMQRYRKFEQAMKTFG